MSSEILAGIITLAFFGIMILAIYVSEKIRKRILKYYGKKQK